MKIIKGNLIKEVGDKAAKIAIHQFGWVEYSEAKRPSEVGTRTRKIEPPIITGVPIKLKEVVYPGDEIKTDVKLVESEPIKIEKKTRKAPVKSKSVKK
jgi:hypothetical protein